MRTEVVPGEVEGTTSIPETLRVAGKKEGKMPVEWQKGALLGEGAYGRVYMGMDTGSGELLAVKEVELGRVGATGGVAALKQEIDVLSRVSHANIVEFRGAFEEEDRMYIFLEYMPSGSVASVISQFSAFSEDVVAMYSVQILDALAYLHGMNIVHRDIKASNLLLGTGGVVKLADFGSAVVLEGPRGAKKGASGDVSARQSDSGSATPSLGTADVQLTGTPAYLAPEMILDASACSPASDIWAFGCSVLEMASGKMPWSNVDSSVAAMYRIAHTQEHPPIHDTASGPLQAFLKRSFAPDPASRPSAHELGEDIFLASAVSLLSARRAPTAGLTTQLHTSFTSAHVSSSPKEPFAHRRNSPRERSGTRSPRLRGPAGRRKKKSNLAFSPSLSALSSNVSASPASTNMGGASPNSFVSATSQLTSTKSFRSQRFHKRRTSFGSVSHSRAGSTTGFVYSPTTPASPVIDSSSRVFHYTGSNLSNANMAETISHSEVESVSTPFARSPQQVQVPPIKVSPAVGRRGGKSSSPRIGGESESSPSSRHREEAPARRRAATTGTAQLSTSSSSSSSSLSSSHSSISEAAASFGLGAGPNRRRQLGAGSSEDRVRVGPGPGSGPGPGAGAGSSSSFGTLTIDVVSTQRKLAPAVRVVRQ